MRFIRILTITISFLVTCGCNQISGINDFEFVDIPTETDAGPDAGPELDAGLPSL